MKLRLSHKLSAVMVVTVLLSAALSAFFISRTTRSAFLELVRENDIRTAVILAENVAAYYERENGWSGVQEMLDAGNDVLPLSGHMGQLPGMMRGLGQAGPMGMMQQRGPGSRPELRQELRFLITDTDGRVLGHNLNMEVPGRISSGVLQKGAPVRVSGGVVGYLFVQSMLEPAMGPFQHAFLQRVYRAIALSMLIIGLLAPAVGVFLMRHITRPLLDLTDAAASVAKGRYTFKLDINRSDEIGDLARSFFGMSDEIRAADEWKRKLIADSAHELRTPVSLLQGNLEMMMGGIYPADNEHLQGLLNETRILSRLVTEMEQLANAEAQHSHYSFENLDLNELFRTVISENRLPARKKELTLELKLPEGANVFVYADRDKLVQVFVNVLQNSIRYTPERGNVLAELFVEGKSSAVCAVEDSGPGIPEEDREKVFERFYRVQHDRNRATGGSGLGLSIAREIVIRHEGTIRLETPKHLGGTRVVITLPLNRGVI